MAAARCAVLALFLFASSVLAAIPQDEITSLPGYNGPFPSKQYSGYITIDQVNGRALHYWFVESENDPANDPVVLWMNGGPGCSSLDGYFYEQGPFHFVNQSSISEDEVPQLYLNPYRWNKIANMIFLEAPAGVGFSYSNNSNDYNTNDNKTADDNFLFLQNFFQAYSEYSSNRFFVAGESYAGIYVPTLVYRIMIHNQAGQSNIPLEGFMVGNGCIGNSVGACSDQGTQIGIDFLYGHGLYSQALHAQIVQACPDPTNPSDQCYQLLEEMGDEVNNVNIYDIYEPCINGGLSLTPAQKLKYSKHVRGPRVPPRLLDRVLKPRGPAECIDGINAGLYLNNDTVRQAIHVLPASQIGEWTICTGNINYDSNTVSLLPIYPTLIQNYRTLIYNGDVDACVPYVGNEEWTSGLGLTVDQPWQAWFVDNQVAGYVTTYTLNNFAFVTVKGSGHMVPEYRPKQALEMFTKFINNQPFTETY